VFDADQASIDAVEVGLSPDDAKRVRRVILLACGTSHHATLAARNWFESIAKVPAVTELASEFRYREPVVSESDLVIAVSQSGETADTLAAIREAARHGARIHAVVNVVGSAIARAAHGALYTHAGPEIGVASTKCFTTQLSALLLLAVHLGTARGALSADQASALLREMLTIPRAMREALKQANACHRVAKARLIEAHNALYLGRGLSHGIALEGALKLKEVSYVHAEGYAAGEMKHGPIALIDSNLPVIVIAPNDQHHEKIASNVQEVRAREGIVIAIANVGDELLLPLADETITIPTIDPQLTPFVSVIPLQLLAYFTADLRGTDVDQPRNLAKTVTVE
jgi:glucosamine--fructose-6-phosphate aminotransferase (isomerizing)